MVIAPYTKVTLNSVEELSETHRGAGGFGSTGKK
jgi:dUTP pyrophosphatase